MSAIEKIDIKSYLRGWMTVKKPKTEDERTSALRAGVQSYNSNEYSTHKWDIESTILSYIEGTL